jgi:hypothetical protein
MKDFCIQLGDIIKVISPKDPEYNGKTYFVYYYDPNGSIELVHTSSMKIERLSLTNGKSEQINNWEKIELCNRSPHKGFARQNGLFPDTWVELEIQGDVREIITAKVQHLEEDMITLLTHPQGNLLYIDFGYKGIPKNIPLRNICLCDPPKSYQGNSVEEADDDSKDIEPAGNNENENAAATEAETAEVTDNQVIETTTPTGEFELLIPDNVSMEEDYLQTLEDETTAALKDVVHETMDESDDIVVNLYSNNIPKPTMMQIQYNIDVQMNDLLESLVYSIPEDKRTRSMLKTAYTHVQRFQELRDQYSYFSDGGRIEGAIVHSNPKTYKPLLDMYVSQLKSPFSWMYLTTPIRRYDYRFIDSSNEDKPLEPNMTVQGPVIEEEYNIHKRFYYEDPVGYTDGLLPYPKMLHELGSNYWKPFVDMNENNTQSTGYYSAGTDLEVMSSNLDFVQRIHGPSYYNIYKKSSETRKSVFDMSIPAEKIKINGLVLLPERYIYDVRHTHQQSLIAEKIMFQPPALSVLFKNKKNISKIYVDDEKLEKRLTANKEEQIYYPSKKNTIKVLQLNDNDFYTDKDVSEASINMLNCVIPNAFALINKYKNENRDKYSLQSYLKPFSTYEYSVQNIPFTAMKMIRYNLNENIREYHDIRKAVKLQYNQYLMQIMNKFNDNMDSTIDHYFDSTKERIRKIMAMAYKFKVKMMRNNKQALIIDDQPRNLIHKCIQDDDMKVLCQMILMKNVDLITAAVSESFVEPKHFYDSNQKAITKQYKSIQEMQKDNDVRDLHYDKQYDGNQYDIMDKYKKFKSGLSVEEYTEFVATKLAEEHGCSMQNTMDLAIELIQGYKLVKEGDYALLEISPNLPPGVQECDFTDNEKEEIRIEASIRKVQKYFKRVQHNWIYDPEVDSSSFAKPENMTCLLDKTDGSKKAKQDILEKYGEKVEDILRNIEKGAELKIKQMKLYTRNRNYKKELFDLTHYFTLLENDNDDVETQSPYLDMLNTIMDNKNDFVLKQENIRKFRYNCCRDPMEQENQSWLYCKETARPLLARFQIDLANAFFRGNYEDTLLQLKRSAKKLDGYYYDIHTGLAICEMDFFDEGRMINDESEFDENSVSWGEGAVEDVQMIIDQTARENRIYTDPQMRKALHILKMIAKNLYLNIDHVEETVMNLCSKFFMDTKVFVSKKKYEDVARKQEEKMKNKEDKYKKKITSYDDYYNGLLLKVVVCTLIIAVQCHSPSLTIRRTFGQCTKDFKGFPLNEDLREDGTIVYLSCILRVMSNDSQPWKTIPKGKAKMEKRLMDFYQETILKHDDVQKLLQAKRDELAKTQDERPEEKELVQNTWPRFLPPPKVNLLSQSDSVKPITKPVHEAYEKALRTGDPAQWNYGGMYFGKALLFSLSIVEMVNNVVQDKGYILGQHTPFTILENSCCNELNASYNPVTYFKEENPSVGHYITNISKINAFFDRDLKRISYGQTCVSYTEPQSQLVQQGRNVFCLYDDVMMYKTFIKYFQLDSTVNPIPVYLRPFLATKPAEYDIKGSIEEKIHFLKENNNALNLKQFTTIMTKVYRENVVKTMNPIELQLKQSVLNSWSKWNQCIHDSIDPSTSNSDDVKLLYKPIQTVQKLLERYFESEYIDDTEEPEQSPEQEQPQINPTASTEKLLNDLENGIIIQIREMKEVLYSTIQSYDQYSQFAKYFKTDSNILNDMSSSNKWLLWFEKMTNDDTVSYMDLARVMKNYLYYLTIGVSNKIKNKQKMKFNTAHWKLNKSDITGVESVQSKRYLYIDDLWDDPSIYHIYNKLQPCLTAIYETISLIYGCFPTERTSLYKRYLLFCIYYVFYRMILVEDSVVEMIVQENEIRSEMMELDNTINLEVLDFLDKDMVVSKMISTTRFLIGLDSGRKNPTIKYLQDSIINYSVIQNNIDKMRSREKNQIQSKFRIDNKKVLMAEKALKKVKMGDYYTDQNMLRKYGKRDKFTLDTNYVNDSMTQDIEMNANMILADGNRENIGIDNAAQALWNETQDENNQNLYNGDGDDDDDNMAKDIRNTRSQLNTLIDDIFGDDRDDDDNEGDNVDFGNEYDAMDNDDYDMMENLMDN